MRLVATALFATLAGVSVVAESTQSWLDDYYAATNTLEAEKDEFIIAKDASLKDARAAHRVYHAAEEAMYRYLFVYHLKQKTGLLDWNDGSWEVSIMVCNCGAEGTVPTDEFKKLFEERSKALIAANATIGREVGLGIAAIRREVPSEWHERKRRSLAALKDRFDALVPLKARPPTDREAPPEFAPPIE